MTMKKEPIKATLHSSAKAISNKDMNALSKKKQEYNPSETKQEEIDKYNFHGVFDKPYGIDNVQLTGTSIVVRLFKENYIKHVEVLSDDTVIYDAYISQIDGRNERSDKPKWMDTPFPYIHAGVIVQISPAAKAHFQKERENIAEISDVIAGEYIVPKEGMIVDLTHFSFNDNRYYINKQERDFIKNPEEHRVIHFDGCVKIHPSYIDGIITNEEEYLRTMSPYAEYVKWKKECETIDA